MLFRSGEHGGELLGAGDHPKQTTTSDPIAAKVLSRGETLAAPAGRADDFSWPRPGGDASTRPEDSPKPVVAAPDAKKDAKERPAIDLHASAQVHPHRYYNYYPGQRSHWYREHHYGWYHRW